MTYPRFYLAFPVQDLSETRKFYCDILGCSTGRESERWIDFDFFGHQVVAHLVEEETQMPADQEDGKDVPAQHFGPVLEWEVFDELAEKLKGANVDFLIEPYVRFEGQPGEQATMFVEDPSGNCLEFKAFKDEAMLFAKQPPGEKEPSS